VTHPTPNEEGFRRPAEWEPHAACWVAWPHMAHEWLEDLEPAREELVALCRAIADADPETGAPRGERIRMLVRYAHSETEARAALADLSVGFVPVPFGDIWMRDIGPIFVRHERGDVATLRFAFNGWGGKYFFDGDTTVAESITATAGVRSFDLPTVLEGGALEVDGEGTCLTTRQCLLNDNRNPGVDVATMERVLCESLGVERVLWLDRGLDNDHTDGHVDTLARFVRPGVVLCMEPDPRGDPNQQVLDDIARDLAAMTDARGRRLEVLRVPSPGAVLDRAGRPMPASTMNFYIGNRTVVVPTYGSAQDDDAVEAIRRCFPDRRTVGLSARALLTGGGAFHCITQEQPASTKVDP